MAEGFGRFYCDEEYDLAPLRALHDACRRHGALLIVDEVQTGVGRTGQWFASSAELSGADAPDAMTLAKGLGGGFPIGAMITFGEHASGLLGPGQHGTTFGGNPLATAVGLATLTTIEDEQILQNVRSVGQHLADGLRAIDGVAEVRAHGLLIGIDLEPIDRSASQTAALAPAVVAAARTSCAATWPVSWASNPRRCPTTSSPTPATRIGCVCTSVPSSAKWRCTHTQAPRAVMPIALWS